MFSEQKILKHTQVCGERQSQNVNGTIIITVFYKLASSFREKKVRTIQYMAIGNEELKHECSPAHMHEGTARMK